MGEMLRRGAVWSAVPLLLAACADEDGKTAEDRWNANYVYIQRTAFLEEGKMTFSVRHTPLGVDAVSAMPLYARLTRPSEADVRVRLAVNGSERLPATAYRLTDKGGAELAAPVLTIAAGATSSDTIRLALVDVAPLQAEAGAMTTEGSVAIEAVETTAPNTREAETRALRQVEFNVAKTAIQYIAQEDGPPAGARKETLTARQFDVTGESSWGGGSVDNLVDGDGRTYMMFLSDDGEVRIDLGAPRRVAAVGLRFYGADYASTRIRVSTGLSEGAMDEVGTLATRGEAQLLTLYSRPLARHVGVSLLETAGYYCLLTGVEVYTVDD